MILRFIEEMQIEVAGKIIDITPSRRNKRIRMRVIPPNGDIKISCPPKTTKKDIEKFINANLDWITRATQKVKVNDEDKSYLQGGNKFILFGRSYEMVEVASDCYSFVIGNENCILGAPKGATYEQKCEYVKDVMKTIAKKVFPPLVQKYENVIGVKCSGVSYRFTTSRWGSCNHQTRKINFSVYAIQKPADYLDYLVCHELLHIIYPNHGEGFKAHLRSIIPKADKISKLR